MNDDTGRRVAARRVDPRSVARLLPAVVRALDERSDDIPLGIAALYAGLSETAPDASVSDLSLQDLTAILGNEYVSGYLDGFSCAQAKRRASLQYVQGLDDATWTRHLLRQLDWGRMLLAAERAQRAVGGQL